MNLKKKNEQNPEVEQKKRKETSVNQVKAIVAAILIGSFALSTFIHSDYMRATRMEAQARRQAAAAAKEERRIEEARQKEREKNLKLYKEQLLESLAENNVAEARKYISYLEEDYGEFEWVQENTEQYRPSAPIPSVQEGTYDTNITLSFELDPTVPGNSDYYGEVHYEVSPAATEEGREIYFTENNTYSVTAYTSNQLGLKSEKVTYTYVLDKLIPNAVVADLESGYFNIPVTVTLSQDQDFPIYYTVDGTDVTTESTLYTGPIELRRGSLDLRVSAYSEVGEVFGEEAAYYYHITPATSNLESQGMVLTSCGTFMASGKNLQLIENGQNTRTYEAEGNIDAFCEYQNGILYTVGTMMYHMDLHTGESVELGQAPGNVRKLLRSNTKVMALTSSGELLHLDENTWTGFLTGVDKACMAPNGSTLYFVSGNNISSLNTATLQNAAVASDSDGFNALAYNDGFLFYTSGTGEFKRCNVATGEITLILEHTSEREHRDPYVAGLLSTYDGYTRTTEQLYTNVMCANGRVYVKSDRLVKNTTIDYWNRSNKSTSTNHNYSWIIFDGETMAQESTIDIESAPIIGDGYYAKSIGQGIFVQSYAGMEPAPAEAPVEEAPAAEIADSAV